MAFRFSARTIRKQGVRLVVVLAMLLSGAAQFGLSSQDGAMISQAKEIDLLSIVVWHEARGETAEGKSLVASTILERVRDQRWPNTIEGVLTQSSQFLGLDFSRMPQGDAIAWARNNGCNRLVDAATLTGAIVVALGYERSGLFSNDDAWRDSFLSAAQAAGEKFWPMPLDEEYKDQLDSGIADLPNIGSRWGGAITAAKFLQAFADPTPWIHLDIAGTAWLEALVASVAPD